MTAKKEESSLEKTKKDLYKVSEVIGDAIGVGFTYIFYILFLAGVYIIWIFWKFIEYLMDKFDKDDK